MSANRKWPPSIFTPTSNLAQAHTTPASETLLTDVAADDELLHAGFGASVACTQLGLVSDTNISLLVAGD